MPMLWMAENRRLRVTYRLVATVYVLFGLYLMGWAHYVAPASSVGPAYFEGVFIALVALAGGFWAPHRLRMLYQQDASLQPFWR